MNLEPQEWEALFVDLGTVDFLLKKMDGNGDFQPFPKQRSGIIQLKQPFINRCFRFQVRLMDSRTVLPAVRTRSLNIFQTSPLSFFF